MGANDVPPVEHNKPAEIRKMKSESNEKLDKLMQQIKKTGTQKDKISMLNQGQIVRLDMPAGWVQSPEKHTLPATANFVEFHNEKTPEAKVCTYFRGHRISPSAGKTFKSLVKAAPHKLSQEEFLQLGEVVRDKAKDKDFELKKSETINLNGKTVLLVEGTYREIKQSAHAIFIDAEGSGEVVQELFYQAPTASYPLYLNEVEEAFKKITWK